VSHPKKHLIAALLRVVRILEDVAFRIARDGVAKLVLHKGKPVTVDGKRLYEVKYDTSLLMKLLPARESY
jgi:hypothetical protein